MKIYMRNIIILLLVLAGAFLIASDPLLAQYDNPRCKDHPMFTRMPNYYIKDCKEKEYDRAEFSDEKGNYIYVEGKYYWASYWITDVNKAPSELQVIRNFQNAIRNIGGVIIKEKLNFGISYMKLTKDKKTWWIIIKATNRGAHYELTIVEKAEMAQEIIADAKSLMSDIQTKGSASVYGIYFDFDKADIKPESEPAIREIAKLLQENPKLKLYVVGHTDNVGGLDYNMKLSKARADAVVKELTTKHKISSDRLKAFGIASLSPVASNDTEEGRAKNRRVELVKQ
ncbi:MAG: OmpA family protein [Proteobacteria bacterium]|nr:OmpA family protein [Pseudomonadota bacterium]